MTAQASEAALAQHIVDVHLQTLPLTPASRQHVRA
jgi:hypothetical protein